MHVTNIKKLTFNIKIQSLHIKQKNNKTKDTKDKSKGQIR